MPPVLLVATATHRPGPCVTIRHRLPQRFKASGTARVEPPACIEAPQPPASLMATAAHGGGAGGCGLGGGASQTQSILPGRPTQWQFTPGVTYLAGQQKRREPEVQESR